MAQDTRTAAHPASPPQINPSTLFRGATATGLGATGIADDVDAIREVIGHTTGSELLAEPWRSLLWQAWEPEIEEVAKFVSSRLIRSVAARHVSKSGSRRVLSGDEQSIVSPHTHTEKNIFHSISLDAYIYERTHWQVETSRGE